MLVDNTTMDENVVQPRNRAERRHPGALLNRHDAAARLGVSVNTLDRLIKSGKLRAARLGTRVIVSEAALSDAISAAEGS